MKQVLANGNILLSLPRRATALPTGLPAFAAFILLAGGFGPNFDLALLATLALVVGAAFLWRPGESPILLLVFFNQWLQSSIAIFHANWLGEDVAAYSQFGGSTNLAIRLSLTGLLVLGAGIRLGAGAPEVNAAAAVRTALAVPQRNWFILYLYAWVLAIVASSFAWVVPGLAQPLLAFASLKWAAFFALAYATFANSRGPRNYFVIVFLFEFLQGIGGYFSDFKSVFFVTLMARAATSRRMSVGVIASLGGMGAILLAIGIVWTAVKGDFRGYVSEGRSQQIIAVDFSTRLSKLGELVAHLDGEALNKATDQFLHRISYVEIFGVVLDVVPESAPYSGGTIWADAVARPFMPRLFFPEKSTINDSLRTNYYTGGLTGFSAGTSISLGYFAESYIDFGPFGMMAPIFAFGLFCGLVYRYFQISYNSIGILGVSLSTAVLLPFSFAESSITKTFGGLALSALVAWGFAKFVAPRWLPWLRAR